MTIAIARAICAVAVRAMPAAQRGWGQAMVAELAHIAAPGPAIIFALGCLRVGVMQRLGDGATRCVSGRVIVVAVALVCAAFHLGCAWSGVEVLRGDRVDPVVDELARGASVAAYRHARPVMVGLIASLGVAHAVVAWRVWRGHPGLFAAWATGAALATILVGCILILARSSSGIIVQLAGPMAQAAVVLWLIHPHLARKRSMT